ncbi:MAG: Acetyltransferase involved in cellulose biosynthesis [Candidatus Alkanophagales archaeon MCA70_species_2]|nr:Acetyltransferase involved in cellulose biosynthesis [Candidatus Alkanophaga liquidiphilum]
MEGLSLSKVELKVAREEDAELWDRLVESSPHGTIFHTWKWLKIVEKHTNSKLYPIIGYKGTEPVALIPLFYQKKFVLRMVFSPPPHAAVPFLGLLMVNYDQLKQNKKESNLIEFQKELDYFLRDEIRANYVNIVHPPNFIDVRPFIWSGYNVVPNFNYSFDLSIGKEKLWENLKKHTRKNIKKASENLEISKGAKEDLRMIYSQLEKRYQEQGRKLKTRLEYLEDIYDCFKECMYIIVAEMNGEVVGGLINLVYKDQICSWVGNAKTRIKGIYPNDLLIWESIMYGCTNGYKVFYEIGANTERLAQYKANFNPDLSLNFAIKKSSRVSKIAENIYSQLRNFL